MKMLVVAVKTARPSPDGKERISEVGVMEIFDGRPGSQLAIHSVTRSMDASGATASSKATCTELLSRIGTSTLIVHDWQAFARLLRAECRRCGVKYLLKRDHPVLDTWLGAKQRFPRQRHDLLSVGKKLGCTSLPGSDMHATLHLLFEVASRLDIIQKHDSVSAQLACTPDTPEEGAGHRTMPQRLALCWRVLMGRA